MENSIVIKCYQEKTYNNYIITINKSVFEMSSNANQPNGLNMYCGEELQLGPDQLKELQLGDLPKGTLIGIVNRLIQEIDIRTEIEMENKKAHLQEKVDIYKGFLNKIKQATSKS